MKAQLIILGSGSALPTRDNFPSSQILEMRDKQYMIDCGEGTQIRMRQMGLKISRLGHIFISHLHGDHCFGLIGLISSFGLLNRTADLYIHGPLGIIALFEKQMEFFCDKLPFKVVFEEHDASKSKVIYEDRSVIVTTIPLLHRIACAGFLFQEKTGDRHIIRDMIDFHQIPLSQINLIKKGADYVKEDGTVIANEELTNPAPKGVSYAYCSDTAYSEKIIPIIQGVDLLYHEATFAEDELQRAITTRHSTASQAAAIACKAGVKQLIIGHYSARYRDKDLLLNEASAIFPSVLLARDTQSYDFPE